KGSPLFDLNKRFQQASIMNFDIEDHFAKLIIIKKYTLQNNEELTDKEKLIIINSKGEEISVNKLEKRIITKFSKLSLTKLLDLKEI
ncbi:25171_t:CDS:1, partial [Gigaspora rosea]